MSEKCKVTPDDVATRMKELGVKSDALQHFSPEKVMRQLDEVQGIVTRRRQVAQECLAE